MPSQIRQPMTMSRFLVTALCAFASAEVGEGGDGEEDAEKDEL